MPIYMQYSGSAAVSVAGLPGQWIEINSFQWGTGRGITLPNGSQADREGSTPSVGEIVVTKPSYVLSRILLNEIVGVGHPAHKKKRAVTIVFTNLVRGVASGPRQTLELRDAEVIGMTRGGAGAKLTIRFSEYHFNGLRNVPVPHALIHS